LPFLPVLKEIEMKCTFKSVSPYINDAMNLPVADVEGAIGFYERTMGFEVLSRADAPIRSAVLRRDGIQIGLAENGGDSSQDGCYFEVDNVETAFAELRANGLERDDANFRIDRHGDHSYKVFFVVAPDGLCYCLGTRQD
jgi:catechol 2,3-dioxygenase-like lactoylglutathione lyase family enzyme